MVSDPGGWEEGPLPYVAAAVVRGKGGWAATELDLGDAADIDDVAEELREVDPGADVSLLFVEADDAYLVIVRLDHGEEPRVFASDAAFAQESRLGAVLLGDVETPALEMDEVLAEAESGAPPVALPTMEPVGDADLLADLGVSAHHLLSLCAREGMLPSDVTAEVAELIGFGDQWEELRGL